MESSEMENREINPQVVEVEIGARNLRKIKIYPLSVGDQLKMTDILAEVFAAFVIIEKETTEEEEGLVKFGSYLVSILKDNLPQIVGFVTEEEKDVLDDITNHQLIGIIEIVYETNFESVAKNAKGLFGKMKDLFQSERPSQPSVKPTEHTSLQTFIPEDSVKEELPTDS